MSIQPQSVVVFATCRSCDRRARLVLNTIDGLVPVEYANGSIRLLPPKDAVPYLVWCTGKVKQYGNFVDGSTFQFVPHGPMRGRAIKARWSPEVPCDDRCTHATGESCRCSCGGANHGSEAA